MIGWTLRHRFARRACGCSRVGISSIGPGRYSALAAIRSSRRSGCIFISRSCMPPDSNWKMPLVSPRQKRSRTFWSVRSIFSMSIRPSIGGGRLGSASPAALRVAAPGRSTASAS